MHEHINPYNQHMRLLLLSRHITCLRSHAAEGQSQDGGGSVAPSHAPAPSHTARAISHMPFVLCISPHSSSTVPSTGFQGQVRYSYVVSGNTHTLDHRLDFWTTLGPQHTWLELNDEN